MDPELITSDWLSGVLGDDVRIVDTKRIGDGLVGMNLRFSLEVPSGKIGRAHV